jgi:excisionase family DNA binding protein
MRWKLEQTFALGLKEAAASIGLSHWTLRKYVARGEITAIRIGRRILIEPTELVRFLKRAGRQQMGRILSPP